jgi:hypothetical protein
MLRTGGQRQILNRKDAKIAKNLITIRMNLATSRVEGFVES